MNLSSFEKSGQSGLFTRGRRVYCNPHNAQNFIVPDGVTKIFAFAIGAGGGGYGNRGSGSNECYTGGAGGGYASGVIAVTPGASITCTIGEGGEGRSYNFSTAAAGGTTSFGSYLTANGGNGGTSQTSISGYFNYQTKEGGGGGASTSGVTEAFTSSGGGTSPGWARYNDYTSYRASAGGGASSGSPWGNGTSVPSKSRWEATGGAGWGSSMHRSSTFRFFMGGTEWRGGCTGGDGSHYQANFKNGNMYNDSQMSSGPGGRGLTARGGYTPVHQLRDHTSQQSNGGSIQDLEYLPASRDGQNGNPNWWFPWDVDGGGGAAGGGPDNSQSRSNYILKGGDGAPGAGGGGCKNNHSESSYGGYYSQTGLGGNGGIGGGGGGCFCQGGGSNYTRPAMITGGNGGPGGGGGGAYTYNTNDEGTNYCYAGGTGGNGLIIVYW